MLGSDECMCKLGCLNALMCLMNEWLLVFEMYYALKSMGEDSLR